MGGRTPGNTVRQIHFLFRGGVYDNKFSRARITLQARVRCLMDGRHALLRFGLWGRLTVDCSGFSGQSNGAYQNRAHNWHFRKDLRSLEMSTNRTIPDGLQELRDGKKRHFLKLPACSAEMWPIFRRIVAIPHGRDTREATYGCWRATPHRGRGGAFYGNRAAVSRTLVQWRPSPSRRN